MILRKLTLLSLLLTILSTAVGMEGPYKKEEISETNLPADAITLISSEGAEFQVVPQIAEFSDTIKGFFEASSVLLPSNSGLTLETKEHTLRDFASKPVELLTHLVNKVQQIIESQLNDKDLALDSLIKAPNGHIIAKNLQKVVNEQLVDTSVEELKQLLHLADFLCMPAFCNAVASIYLGEFQKEHKVCDISDLKIWLEKFGFGEQVSSLLIKHWYLQQAGITQEWSIKDLIATGENPVIDTNGNLDLSSKNLTSLDGLYDIPSIECVKELYLDNNQLIILDVGIFDGLSALEALSLYNNKLSVLEVGVFNGLSALKRLNLGNNQLTVLGEGVFNGLSALERLSLHSNQLSVLEVGVFDGLPVLNSLQLGWNKLSAFEVGVFNELVALENLFLYCNKLSAVEAGVFNGLLALKGLNLGNNQLSVLGEGIFNGLSALKELYLYENKLSALEVEIFNELTALKYLCINNNQLTEQDRQDIEDKIKQTAPGCYIKFE